MFRPLIDRPSLLVLWHGWRRPWAAWAFEARYYGWRVAARLGPLEVWLGNVEPRT